MKLYYVCFEDLMSGIFSSVEAAVAAVKKAAKANPSPVSFPVDIPMTMSADEISMGIPYVIDGFEDMFFIEQYELDIPFKNYD